MASLLISYLILVNVKIITNVYIIFYFILIGIAQRPRIFTKRFYKYSIELCYFK